MLTQLMTFPFKLGKKKTIGYIEKNLLASVNYFFLKNILMFPCYRAAEVEGNAFCNNTIISPIKVCVYHLQGCE